MRKRKSIMSVFAMLAAVCMLFTACGQDPVAKEIQDFANTKMKPVNEQYQKFSEDYNAISSHTTDYVDYINDTLIPEVDGIISGVEEISTEHDEVTDLKEKYLKVMNGYRNAMQKCADAVANEDSEGLMSASEDLEQVTEDLNTYNTTLKDLGEKYDMKVIE